MKSARFVGLLSAAGLLVGSTLPAFAQNEEERQDRRGGSPRGGAGIFQALDSNGDGKLDQSELDMAIVSLRKLDKNKDGEITRDELGGGSASGGERRSGQTRRGSGQGLAALDKDGDGKISKEEAPSRMADNWERVDTNGDGFLDKEEQQKMIEAFRRRMQERGQQRPQSDRPDRTEGQGGGEKPKRPSVADE